MPVYRTLQMHVQQVTYANLLWVLHMNVQQLTSHSKHIYRATARTTEMIKALLKVIFPSYVLRVYVDSKQKKLKRKVDEAGVTSVAVSLIDEYHSRYTRH